MPKIMSIVHIYRHEGSIYVVPVVQLANGPWQESFPVYQINNENDVGDLTQALAKIQQDKSGVVDSAPNPWNSEFGEALRDAPGLVAIRWFEDGFVKIIPQEQHISFDENDGTVERGWYDKKAETIELASGTPISHIAQKVQDRL